MQPDATGTRGDMSMPSFGGDEYTSRRIKAYNTGEAKARRREISSDAYLFLYKELVNLAGARTYCWPGLDFLARTLETSGGTIKRWMHELEDAGLIRRKPRPGGRTSLTYITSFLQDEPSMQADSSSQSGSLDSVEADRATIEHPVSPSVDITNPTSTGQSGAASPAARALFFVPKQRIGVDRNDGSKMIRQSAKTQNLKPGGCGTQQPRGNDEHDSLPELTSLLHEEGILSPGAIAELHDKPRIELEAISRYLDRQRNVVSRAGLFMWLARNDFGAALLHARSHGKLKEWPACQSEPDGVNNTGANLPGTECHMDESLEVIWSELLRRLAALVSQEDYATWIEPVQLLELHDNVGIVGVPNVFVRDVVAARYQEHIAEAISSLAGHPVTVRFVIR